MNTQGTSGRRVTVGLPTFVVFSPYGNPIGPFTTAKAASEFAEKQWPGKDCDVQKLWSPEEIQAALLAE